MEITRIKYDMEKVIIGYENPNSSTKEVNLLQSQDVPNDEFIRCMLALNADVLEIADLPDMYKNGMAVEEIKFTVKDDAEYVQFIAKKALVFQMNELKLTLPAVPLMINGKDDKGTQARLINNCNNLKDAAIDYIRGLRQQESLFLNIGLNEDIQKSAKAVVDTIPKNGGGAIKFGDGEVKIKQAS
jgi:hypothetical protein